MLYLIIIKIDSIRFYYKSQNIRNHLQSCFLAKIAKGFVCLKVRCNMRLYTNELKISWLESVTSQSNNRSFNPVLRLFFYFKGEKMNIEKIRRLNDTFRKSFNGGRVVLTRCVQSLFALSRKKSHKFFSSSLRGTFAYPLLTRKQISSRLLSNKDVGITFLTISPYIFLTKHSS